MIFRKYLAYSSHRCVSGLYTCPLAAQSIMTGSQATHMVKESHPHSGTCPSFWPSQMSDWPQTSKREVRTNI